MKSQPINKVLFATDVPFWLMADGAQQRIMSLYRFLRNSGCDSQVFFVGTTLTRDAVANCPEEVRLRPYTSSDPPRSLAGRLRWFANATMNQAMEWLTTAAGNQAVQGPESMTLEDFRWPWAAEKFREVVDELQPDLIVCEYVKMAYLLDALDQADRERIVCAVDTHDLLYKRAEHFQEHGFPHWLKIDRDEEASALQKFDLILAIQPHEAVEFKKLAPYATVLTVGHAVELANSHPAPLPEQDVGRLRVGYIGSKNYSNWYAIREFLNEGWPVVMERNRDECELVIAGGICEWIEQALTDAEGAPPGAIPADRMQGVKCLGHVPTIDEFYSQIEVLINPVRFGTGLKIKNAEALSFARLLITTTAGFDGMPESTRMACMVVDSVPEIGEAINSLIQDRPAIRRLQNLALELSRTEFSADYAYRELAEWLERYDPTAKSEKMP